MFWHPLAGIQLPKGTVEPLGNPTDAARRELFEESGIDTKQPLFSLEKTPEWFADKFGIFITSICCAHEINGAISPQMMGALSCNFIGMPCWRHRRQIAALYMRAC